MTLQFYVEYMSKIERVSDLMLGLDESMGQLVIANSVRWYGYALRREDSHVL